jgi:hypothetical protein
MLEFRPAIIRDDAIIELPRPILACRIHDSWDFLKMKVPLQDGNQLAGPSRDGVDISIDGQIGAYSGELKLTEGAMLDALLALRSALHVTDAEGYLFALFATPDHSQARYFRRCLTSRFDVDFSNPRLYAYSVAIHAADPVLREGALP